MNVGQLLADGYCEAIRAAIDGARPEPELHIDEWSEQEMVLPKSSSEPGPYRISRMYPSRRVLQCLSPDHPARRVVVRGASQMLKTQCGLNAISAWIHRAPSNILALEPTDKLAKRLSARIQQAARDVAPLRKLMAQQRSRDSRNTMDAKEFPGGTLYICTSGAAANLAEIPARYLFLDEVDRMEQSVDGEGDPVEIAEARTTRFSSNCKIYAVSSPTILGFSKIDKLYEMGTQEVYRVPCPHCQHPHELVVENFHYTKADDDSGHIKRAWFVCPDCGAEIDEHHKGWMLRDEADGGLAHWHANSQGDGETVSFHINAFYSPFGSITWLQLARQLDRAKERKAKGDKEGMRVFWNTRLALSYSDAEDNTSWQELKARAEDYPRRTVPNEALVLTMSTDTQGNRLEAQIEAWGPGLEHWLVDYAVFYGDPSDPPEKPGSVWAQLDEMRAQPLMHESGVPLYISASGIDSGGNHTQDVYNYGFARRAWAVRVLKGASRPNKPICSSTPSKVDLDWGGRRLDDAVDLWTIGTDVAKDWLYNRMRKRSGEGAFHVPKWAPDEWFKGVVSEQRVTKLRKGRPVVSYDLPSGMRNEPLDLCVYNLAMAYNLGLHRWARLDWQGLRDKLIPPGYTPDLFAPAPTPAPATAAAAVPVPEVSVQQPEPRAGDTEAGAEPLTDVAADVPAAVLAVAVPALPAAPALQQITPRVDQPVHEAGQVPAHTPVPAAKGAPHAGTAAMAPGPKAPSPAPASAVATITTPPVAAPAVAPQYPGYAAPVGRRIISRGI
jgi:phage terminase large subunit GpA-like protein